MKKYLLGALVGAILTAATPTIAENIKVSLNTIKVKINGTQIKQPTILFNGTTYVPLRVVSESLGMDVKFDKQNNTAGITNPSSPVSLPIREKQGNDSSWLKETGSVTIGNKKYPNSLIVSKENKFYWDSDMIFENYSELKDYINLKELDIKTYNNKKYISYGEVMNLFKECDIRYDFKMQSSFPPNEKINKAGPDWLKEPGTITMGGTKYRAGLVVTTDNKFYLNSKMIFDNYPDLKNNLDIQTMDFKTYKGVQYIYKNQLLNYFEQNGIIYDFVMNSSKPPQD